MFRYFCSYIIPVLLFTQGAGIILGVTQNDLSARPTYTYPRKASLWGRLIEMEQKSYVDSHRSPPQSCAGPWEADRAPDRKLMKNSGIPDWYNLRWKEKLPGIRYQLRKSKKPFLEKCLRESRKPYVALRRQLILGGRSWKGAMLFGSVSGGKSGLQKIMMQSPRLKTWQRVEKVRTLFRRKYGFSSSRRGYRSQRVWTTNYEWKSHDTKIHMAIKYYIQDMFYLIRISYSPSAIP